MKFFLPVQETKIAEESYQAIKKQTGWAISDTRYQRGLTPPHFFLVTIINSAR